MSDERAETENVHFSSGPGTIYRSVRKVCLLSQGLWKHQMSKVECAQELCAPSISMARVQRQAVYDMSSWLLPCMLSRSQHEILKNFRDCMSSTSVHS